MQSADAHARTLIVGGRVLPSVTTALSVLAKPELARWREQVGPREADLIAAEAADLGKRVHAACALYLRRASRLALDLPADFEAMVEAFRAWADANIAEVFAVEERLISERWGYFGTPDAILRLHHRKRATVIDFKVTGDIYLTHVLQTAAYWGLARESGYPVSDRLLIRFDRQSPGKLVLRHPRRHTDDFAAFTYALALWRRTQEALL